MLSSASYWQAILSEQHTKWHWKSFMFSEKMIPEISGEVAVLMMRQISMHNLRTSKLTQLNLIDFCVYTIVVYAATMHWQIL
jgi:hypothetical protein